MWPINPNRTTSKSISYSSRVQIFKICYRQRLRQFYLSKKYILYLRTVTTPVLLFWCNVCDDDLTLFFVGLTTLPPPTDNKFNVSKRVCSINLRGQQQLFCQNHKVNNLDNKKNKKIS